MMALHVRFVARVRGMHTHARITSTRSMGASTCAMDAKGHAQQVREEGYAVVPGAAQRFVETVSAEIAAPLSEGTAEDGTRRLGALFTHSRTAQSLALLPVALALADELLLPSCARCQLNFTGAVALDPGCTAQGLHRDVTMYPFLHTSVSAVCHAMLHHPVPSWGLTCVSPVQLRCVCTTCRMMVPCHLLLAKHHP